MQTPLLPDRMDGVMAGQPVEGGVENGAAGMGGHRPTGHMAPHVEIKLFVGRVPQSMEDTDLRPVFEEFGEVKEAIIIRDKATGKHKNSAFVKMGMSLFGWRPVCLRQSALCNDPPLPRAFLLCFRL